MNKGLLAAAFAAVAAVGAALGLFTMVPPFNGAKKLSVWQEKAKAEIEKSLPPQAKVEFVSEKNIATAEGKFASKVLTFKIKGPFGHFSKTADVRCDQDKVEGVRGGEIKASQPVFSNPTFGWNI
jgi:hypothetical protein